MQFKTYGPIKTHSHTQKYGQVIVELTDADMVRAAQLLAAEKEIMLPPGFGHAKQGKSEGITLVTIYFDPAEAE